MIQKFGWISVDDIPDQLSDGWYYATSDGNDVYYRRDDQNLGENWEIGFRPYAINVSRQDHLTFDGLSVFGPAGCNDSTTAVPCDSKVDPRAVQVFRLDTVNHVKLKNIEMSYGGFKAINQHGRSHDIVLENVNIHHYAFATHFKGSYERHVPGSQSVTDVLIDSCSFWEIGSRADEVGDRELVGILGVKGVTIRRSYFGKYMHDHEIAARYNSNQIAIVSAGNILIEHNLFYDSGTTNIAFGGGSTALGTQNVTIRHNVFDRRGYNFADGVPDGRVSSIVVGAAGRNWSIVQKDCGELNVDPCEDHGGDVHITNNLFINGRDLSDWASANEKWSTIAVGYEYYPSLVIANNIFYKNGGPHELYINSHWESPRSGHIIWDNVFFADAKSDWNSAVIRFRGVATWDHQHIQGGAGTFNHDMVEKHKFPADNVRGNRNIDPALATTTAGPEHIKAPTALNKGSDLSRFGDGFNTALHTMSDFTSWPPKVVTTDPMAGGSPWQIGPYVYEP